MAREPAAAANRRSPGGGRAGLRAGAGAGGIRATTVRAKSTTSGGRASEIAGVSADVSDYFHAHNHLAFWRYAPWAPANTNSFRAPSRWSWPRRRCSRRRRSRRTYVPMYVAIAAVTLVLSLGPQPAAWGHCAASRPVSAAAGRRAGPRRASRPGAERHDRGARRARRARSGRLLDRADPGERGLVVSLGALIVTEGWVVADPTARFDPIRTGRSPRLRIPPPERRGARSWNCHSPRRRARRYAINTSRSCMVIARSTAQRLHPPLLTSGCPATTRPLADANHPRPRSSSFAALGVAMWWFTAAGSAVPQWKRP